MGSGENDSPGSGEGLTDGKIDVAEEEMVGFNRYSRECKSGRKSSGVCGDNTTVITVLVFSTGT